MMDTAADRRAWIVKPRTGFTSFKTTKAIEYKERWPRDVLIQATLSPEIETLSPFEGNASVPADAILAFECGRGNGVELVVLCNSSDGALPAPSGFQSAICVSRSRILNGSGLLTARMIWSRRSYRVAPETAVRILSLADAGCTLRQVTDSAVSEPSQIIDSVLALACNGQIDIFWRPVLSESTKFETRNERTNWHARGQSTGQSA